MQLVHGEAGAANPGRDDASGSRPKAVSASIEAVRAFFADQPFQLAAALSYYTLLSIAPLLLVVTGVAGLLLGDAAVRDALVTQAGALVGNDGASLMRTVLENANEPERGLMSMIVGSVLVLVGASTVFAQLQAALNRIWHVEAAPSNAVLGFVRHRLISLSVVLGIGFLLWVSLVVSAVLNGIHDMLDAYVPGMGIMWRVFNVVVSFGLVTVLLALLFKYVPDVKIAWRDTWVGAAVTAALFTVGKDVIGLYLGQASVGSAYGAAGSAVVLMVWVYYASLILFLGAEITQVLARQRGRPLTPSRHARLFGGAGSPAAARPAKRAPSAQPRDPAAIGVEDESE